jgi:hypothetical protein
LAAPFSCCAVSFSKFFSESVNCIDTSAHPKIESSLNLLQKEEGEAAVGSLSFLSRNDYHSDNLYILFSGSPLGCNGAGFQTHL